MHAPWKSPQEKLALLVVSQGAAFQNTARVSEGGAIVGASMRLLGGLVEDRSLGVRA